MKFIKKAAMFLFGGGSYVGIELLWRGRSHSSMFFAGGLCFLLLGRLDKARPRLPLGLRGFAGAGVVTMVELAMGLLVNRKYTVWDYRDQWLNFHGQICLPFYFLWVPLSLCAMSLYKVMDRWLSSGPSPRRSWRLHRRYKNAPSFLKGIAHNFPLYNRIRTWYNIRDL